MHLGHGQKHVLIRRRGRQCLAKERLGLIRSAGAQQRAALGEGLHGATAGQ
jgi:hypothetical protein